LNNSLNATKKYDSDKESKIKKRRKALFGSDSDEKDILKDTKDNKNRSLLSTKNEYNIYEEDSYNKVKNVSDLKKITNTNTQNNSKVNNTITPIKQEDLDS
jgi:hypothetical protein